MFARAPRFKCCWPWRQSLVAKVWRLGQHRTAGLVIAAVTAGVLWACRLPSIGFLSDDPAQLMDWACGTAPPVSAWWHCEYNEYYRPLAALVLRLEYLVWGMDAAGYRLTNLALHVSSAVCVLYIASRLGLRHHAALLASLLFAYNPGHIIGVLSVAGVINTLCSMLCLAALATHLRAQETRPIWYAVSLSAFAAALLSKENAVSLPFLILALHLLVMRGGWRATVVAVVPYLAVLAGYLGLRYWLFGHLPLVAMAHRNNDPWLMLTNTVLYAGTSLSPWGLHGFKVIFRGNLELLSVLCVAVLVGSATAAMIWRRRLTRTHLFWVAWFGLTLAPAVRLYSPWNSYLPAVGTSMLLAMLAFSAGISWWSRIRRGTVYAWLAVAVCYQFVYQTDWIRASALAEAVITEATRAVEDEQGPWYLAGIPAEYRDVPVFGGPWGIDGALRFRGITGVLPTVLPAVHYESLDSGTMAEVDGVRSILLRVQSESSFFRLNELNILSREVEPSVGYAFAVGPYAAKVVGSNDQGQPSALELVPTAPIPPARVLTWNGSRLVPAAQAKL